MYMFKKWSTRLRDTTNSLQNELRKGLQGIPKLGGVAMLTASLLMGGGLAAAADAATYYLSLTGSNANAGTSTSAPWKTFSFAIPKLKPGDTLVLRDGTYTKATNGSLQMICGNRAGSNAVNGTSAQRITVKAENERQAFIKGDGSGYPLHMLGCAYWTIHGLRFEGRDLEASKAPNGHTVYITSSNNIIFRRNLVRFNNRYKNGAIVSFGGSTASLIEENEVYSYSRNGLGGGSRNTYRRNYINSRNHADISGGLTSNNPARGDTGYIYYPSSDNLVENNISEGNSTGFQLSALGPTKDNKLYGNISLGDGYGALLTARGSGTDMMPHDNLFVDFVAVDYSAVGFYARSAEGTQCRNCTLLGGTSGNNGLGVDVNSSHLGDGYYSFFGTNLLAMNHSGGGVMIDRNIDQWSIDFANSFAAASFFKSYSGNYFHHTQSVDPELGACKVFIPESSPMKGAGQNGADIGANVLYRYENGVLTPEHLWNPTTGQFPCGAVIPRVNDIAGASCFDVHKRLNVNVNGCSLPASYSQQSIASAAPKNVRILGID
jgi:hypothetical protein